MTIEGKAHCLFEQSGTFRNAFMSLGIPSECYDIKDDFGQTDHVCDLFREIEEAYESRPSPVFDGMGRGDLIMAFFPCIYFCNFNSMWFQFGRADMKGKPVGDFMGEVLSRLENRTRLHALLLKLVAVAGRRGIPLIVENPATGGEGLCYLLSPFNFPPPAVIDGDRNARGDYFRKPTAYWFFGCEPTRGLFSPERRYKKRRVCDCRDSPIAGERSTERSMISPEYARNFICDFVLGRRQPHTLPTLF